MASRLPVNFFDKSCLELGRSLLGKIIVRMVNGIRLSGRIVELECYTGIHDKACSGYGGRRTTSNEAVFMKAGTAYVYMTYGMYYCFNISSQEEGASVFIRGIEPLEGIEKMQELRLAKMKSSNKKLSIEELGNGPAKLCSSFSIDKNTFNETDLTTSKLLWFEESDEVEEEKIVKAPRIGIDRAGSEWAHKPLRFYIADSKFVSIHDKAAEGNYLKNEITENQKQTSSKKRKKNKNEESSETVVYTKKTQYDNNKNFSDNQDKPKNKTIKKTKATEKQATVTSVSDSVHEKLKVRKGRKAK